MKKAECVLERAEAHPSDRCAQRWTTKIKRETTFGAHIRKHFFFSVEPQTEPLEAWRAETDEWLDRSPLIQDTRASLINNEEQRRKSHSKFNTLLDSPDCWEIAVSQLHSTCCGGSQLQLFYHLGRLHEGCGQKHVSGLQKYGIFQMNLNMNHVIESLNTSILLRKDHILYHRYKKLK